jgi:hypothetical protein
VQVKQTYFWANKGQPTPCPLQIGTPRKLHFHDFFNKNLVHAYTESELSVLGVAGKLGENPVHECQIFYKR